MRRCGRLVAKGNCTNAYVIYINNLTGQYHLGDKDVEEFMVLISIFRNCDMGVAQIRFQ